MTNWCKKTIFFILAHIYQFEFFNFFVKLVSHCDSSYMTHLDKLAVDFNIKIKEKFLVLTYPTFGFSVNIHKKKKKTCL